MTRWRFQVVALVVSSAVVAPVSASAQVEPVRPVETWAMPDKSLTAATSAPVIADIDRDGVNDIGVGGLDGRLRVLSADGDELWARDVVLPGSTKPTAVDGAPAVGDIDNDGWPEIVVGAGSLLRKAQQGGAVVFSHTGDVQWRFLGRDHFDMWDPSVGQTADGYREGVVASPTLADVDGDGRLDVVLAVMDNRVYVLNGTDGSVMPGFPIVTDDSLFSTPAAADVDGDGRAEIFVGTAGSAGGVIDQVGGLLLAIDWQDGQATYRWQRRVDDVVNSSPAIGDIDGDGDLEVVVGSGLDYGNEGSRKVYAFHARNGSLQPGWPKLTAAPTHGSPALGDLTGDGIPEVVFAGSDFTLYAWRGDGRPLWTAPTGAVYFHASPVIADLDGDGAQDIAVPTDAGLQTYRGADGTKFAAQPFGGWRTHATPAVAAFAGEWWLVAPRFQGDASEVVAYPLPAPGARPAWPEWMRNARHSATYAPSEPVCDAPPLPADLPDAEPAGFHPVVPDRLLDTRDGTGVLAGPLDGGCVLALQVGGRAGVPVTGVTAVTLNVTVTRSLGAGFVTVYPCGEPPPTASNLNARIGSNDANLVTVRIGDGGRVCFFAQTATDLIADVAGWYGDGGAPADTGAGFHPLTPGRALDTRDGNRTDGGSGPATAGGIVELDLRGRAGVPAEGVAAVALNVTATETAGAGYVRAFPCAQGPPNASNLNYRAGQTVPNHVVVPVSDGKVCFTSYDRAHLIVDVLGWFGGTAGVDGARLQAATPARVLDTRTGLRTDGGAGPLGALVSAPLRIAGRAGVPSAGVVAVTLNVTVTGPPADGYLTVFPCGQPVPSASNLNYVAGQTVPNLVTVPLGAGGEVCFASYAPADVIADVAGWYVT